MNFHSHQDFQALQQRLLNYLQLRLIKARILILQTLSSAPRVDREKDKQSLKLDQVRSLFCHKLMYSATCRSIMLLKRGQTFYKTARQTEKET